MPPGVCGGGASSTPGLKARPVSNFDTEKDNGAVQLEPLFLSLGRYIPVGDPRQLPASLSSQPARLAGHDRSALDRLMRLHGE